jgi:hypothetical protein
LLLGPGETFANSTEETHPGDLMSFRSPTVDAAA